MADNEQIGLTPADVVSAKHKRATPLKPAVWMTGVLVWATVIAMFLRVPDWGAIFLCSLTALSFLLYLGSYIFLLAADREALRTERYALKGSPAKLHTPQGQSRLEASGEMKSIPAGIATPVPAERRLPHADLRPTETPRQARPMEE